MCEDGPDTSEPAAIAAIKEGRIEPGDVIVLIAGGRWGRAWRRVRLEGSVNVVDVDLATRPLRADLAPDPALPEDTRLWALLQELSGGTWGGCVYDAEAVRKAVLAGRGLAG